MTTLREDIQQLQAMQQRIMSTNADDPKVRVHLDKVYAGLQQTIEAMAALENVFLNPDNDE